MTKYLVLVLGIVICSIVLFKCSCNPFKKEVAEIKQQVAVRQDEKQVAQIKATVEHDTTAKYQKAGIVHSVKQVANGNYQQLALFYKKGFDSICREYGIQKKQLDNVMQEKLAATGDITSDIQKAGKNYVVPLDDCFFHGTAEIDSNVTKIHLLYKSSVRLSGVRYWQRPHHIWFIKWGMPVFKDDLHTDCENVVVDSITDIRLERSKNPLKKH